MSRSIVIIILLSLLSMMTIATTSSQSVPFTSTNTNTNTNNMIDSSMTPSLEAVAAAFRSSLSVLTMNDLPDLDREQSTDLGIDNDLDLLLNHPLAPLPAQPTLPSNTAPTEMGSMLPPINGVFVLPASVPRMPVMHTLSEPKLTFAVNPLTSSSVTVSAGEFVSEKVTPEELAEFTQWMVAGADDDADSINFSGSNSGDFSGSGAGFESAPYGLWSGIQYVATSSSSSSSSCSSEVCSTTSISVTSSQLILEPSTSCTMATGGYYTIIALSEEDATITTDGGCFAWSYDSSSNLLLSGPAAVCPTSPSTTTIPLAGCDNTGSVTVASRLLLASSAFAGGWSRSETESCWSVSADSDISLASSVSLVSRLSDTTECTIQLSTISASGRTTCPWLADDEPSAEASLVPTAERTFLFRYYVADGSTSLVSTFNGLFSESTDSVFVSCDDDNTASSSGTDVVVTDSSSSDASSDVSSSAASYPGSSADIIASSTGSSVVVVDGGSTGDVVVVSDSSSGSESSSDSSPSSSAPASSLPSPSPSSSSSESPSSSASSTPSASSSGVNYETASSSAGSSSSVSSTGSSSTIDACTSIVCANGGTCSVVDGSAVCACVTGYSGDLCATNTDDCASSPCSNDGTCVDGINSYTCSCVEPWSGTNCDENLLPRCSAAPCMNNATCTNTTGTPGYYCACSTGFGGDQCQIDTRVAPPAKAVRVIQLLSVSVAPSEIPAFKLDYGNAIVTALRITISRLSWIYVGPPRTTTLAHSFRTLADGTEVSFDLLAPTAAEETSGAVSASELFTMLNEALADSNSTLRQSTYGAQVAGTYKTCSDGTVAVICDEDAGTDTSSTGVVVGSTLEPTGSSPVLLGIGIGLGVVGFLVVIGLVYWFGCRKRPARVGQTRGGDRDNHVLLGSGADLALAWDQAHPEAVHFQQAAAQGSVGAGAGVQVHVDRDQDPQHMAVHSV